MEQTADAHGNFARESNTFAHQQQVLAAGWGNLKSSIGALFLPVLTAALKGINSVLPSIDAMVSSLSGGGNAFQAFAEAFKAGDGDITSSGLPGFFERLGFLARTLADTFAPVWSSISAAIGPLIPQVLSLAASFSPLSLVFQALRPVLPALAGALAVLATAIGGTLLSALTGLQPIIQTLVGTLSGVLVAVMPAITAVLLTLGQAFAALVPVVMPLVSTVLQLAATLISQLAPIFTQLVSSVLPPVVSIFGSIIGAVAPLVSLIGALLIPIIQALMPVVVAVFGAIANVISSAMQIIQGVIQVVTGVISGNWSSGWSGIGNITSGAWNLIKSLISGALGIVRSVIQGGLSLISSLWSGAWNGLRSFLSGAWSGITSGVSSGISGVVSTVAGLPGRVLGVLGNLGGLLVGSGQALIEGFINGINNMIGRVTSAASNLVQKVRDFFPFSPAKRGAFAGRGYTTYSGRALTQDFARSIAGNAGAVARAASLVAASAHAALVPEAPSFRTPTVESAAGGSRAALASGGVPLIGELTLQSSGNTREDLNEAMFQVRRIARGGL